MDLVWVATSGYVLAAVMCGLQWLISSRKEEPWSNTARYYRSIIRFTVASTVFGILGISLLLIFDVQLGRSVLVPRLASVLDPTAGPATLLLAGFFAGAIQLLFDRASDDATPREFASFFCELWWSFFDNKRLSSKESRLSFDEVSAQGNHRAWTLWFGLLLVISASGALMNYYGSHASMPASQPTNELPAMVEFAKALAVVYCAILGFFCWVYVSLFCKLTMAHHFSGRAARVFLGGVFQSWIPRQVVLIGPPEAGKTAFAESKVFPANDPLSKTTEVVARPFATADGQWLITAIDTPGENLGDHLMIASRFRTDAIILILEAGSLNEESFRDSNTWTIDSFEKLAKPDTKEKRYLAALKLATNRDNKSLPAKSVFGGVKAFILYFNHHGRADLIQSMFNRGSPLELAVAIGARFGVDSHACFALGGQAIAAGEARDLLSKVFSNAVPAQMAAQYK